MIFNSVLCRLKPVPLQNTEEERTDKHNKVV